VRMVRALLAELDTYQISAAHLRAVTALCRGGAPSAAVDLPHGLTARRVYGDLVLGPRQEAAVLAARALDPDREQTIEAGPWRITCRPAAAPAAHPEGPNHVFLARDALAGPLVIRPRQTGDAGTLPRRGRKTLKKLFIDAPCTPAGTGDLARTGDAGGPCISPASAPTRPTWPPGGRGRSKFGRKSQTEREKTTMLEKDIDHICSARNSSRPGCGRSPVR
jgi:tRNA(Ile)-lysidine synthase